MTTTFAIQTAFEILLAAAVIVCTVKEDKLIVFEKKIANKIKRSKNNVHN